MASIIQLSGGVAAFAGHVALPTSLGGPLGLRESEGYTYAAMGFSAMVAALNISPRTGRELKRGISPAVTNGEIA